MELDLRQTGEMIIRRTLMKVLAGARAIGDEPLSADPFGRAQIGRKLACQIASERLAILVPTLARMGDRRLQLDRNVLVRPELGERLSVSLPGARLTELVEDHGP